ncbi:cbb3-type cytochrome oxidase assembly protein CcoS [Alkalimonas mucilaginosa]|uniref:Cbb3-type cytochrome oxidase assembly protein CcoS n=1 Tax=Alkalimonas mucilaginosa TaxID=3057676 RepID=A0ABU7JDM1_9GAMM|nr:cbb3-type cytochrome oxidase assembly protein CcoS [Alkalimonas sp. MEB004]MEE2023745.1 cbb3-type cytochrome oxidase assembly protein CcoS [Alkalimonas sp. MEB004]
MSVIYVLIPIAVLFVMIGLAIFFWAVKSKQFDDLDKQGFSILFDDEPKAPAKTEPTGQPDHTTNSSDHEPR